MSEANPEMMDALQALAIDKGISVEVLFGALADALEPAAEKEDKDVDAAAALELRNRCFWSADKLAKEIREGGRYAFRLQPKIAAKFVSRYRLSAGQILELAGQGVPREVLDHMVAAERHQGG